MQPDVTSGVPEVVLDLPGLRMLAAGEYGGELEVLVETVATGVMCPRCGRRASSHGRREHLLRDIAVSVRATVLVWCKRIWRCRNTACPTVTWSETTPGISPRAALTDRVRVWTARQVGQHATTVAAVARGLGTGWATVMRAVTNVGEPLVADPHRLDAVSALGVDEHVWQHAGLRRRTAFATGIVDLTPGRPARLLDIAAGRTGAVYGDWLAARDPLWRSRITVAVLDPFRGYRTALRDQLPHAIHVVDAFHIVKLGFAAVDEVRRRVQQDQLGHRGHTGDPLFEVRRLLRRRADRLSERNITKLQTALHAGDPDDEVLLAWYIAQDLAKIYISPDPQTGKARTQAVITAARSCPIPEIARLGRTLTEWQPEIEAYFDTGGASNGPTEAVNLLIEKIRRVGHGYRNFTLTAARTGHSTCRSTPLSGHGGVAAVAARNAASEPTVQLFGTPAGASRSTGQTPRRRSQPSWRNTTASRNRLRLRCGVPHRLWWTECRSSRRSSPLMPRGRTPGPAG